jgi:hypothetical protein
VHSSALVHRTARHLRTRIPVPTGCTARLHHAENIELSNIDPVQTDTVVLTFVVALPRASASRDGP